MKKGIFIIILWFITGCSNQEIKCTRVDNSSNDLEIKEELIIKYKKEIVSFDFESNIKAGVIYKKYMKELESNMIVKYITNMEANGIEKHSIIKGQKINIKIKGKAEKMDDNSKNTFNIFRINSSIKEIKKELKINNYSCE